MNRKSVMIQNNTSNQLDITNIYKTIFPTTTEHTLFFKCTWIIAKIDLSLDHKTSVKNFERNQIMQSIFFHYRGIKLEIHKSKLSRQSSKYLETK